MDPVPETKADNSWWTQAGPVTQLAVFVVVIAGSWFMLKELAILLRPLLLAIMLCYVILPVHSRLRKSQSELITVFIMVGGASALALGIGLLVYGSLLQMNEELPHLTERAQELTANFQIWSEGNLPAWMKRSRDDLLRAESQGARTLQNASKVVVSYAADILVESLVVGLYVIFLLLEARRIKKRVAGGFDLPQARLILDTVQTINDGIASYLKAKVLSSLILAVPVTVVLYAFGVKFAVMWGLLTFLCNFIPYVGTFIACSLPILFGFFDLPPDWKPIAMAITIVSWHSISSALIEPHLLGKAVGLSPIVILISLTFWGLCWGLVGMFLAVPLTVTLKIIFENIETTKPIANLLGDE